jgi:hypothetical protein
MVSCYYSTAMRMKEMIMSVKRREDEGKECMHVSIKFILTLKKVTINAQTSKGSLPSTTESIRLY